MLKGGNTKKLTELIKQCDCVEEPAQLFGSLLRGYNLKKNQERFQAIF